MIFKCQKQVLEILKNMWKNGKKRNNQQAKTWGGGFIARNGVKRK